MRALVTGATGLVGSHLCERLVADGWSVRALVRDIDIDIDIDIASAAHTAHTAHSAWLVDAGVTLVRGDTTDVASFATAAAGTDVIFHAAAAITPAGGWDAFARPNVLGTRNAIDASRAAGARLLHVSSVAVYGGRVRGAGGDEHPVDEEHVAAPLAPDEHYARSKRESEALVLEAHRRGAAWATAIRPCVVYGRRDRQFVPRLARAMRFGVVPLVGAGRATMAIVHAANVADAALRAATTDAAGGLAFNVTNDDDIVFAEFVRLAARGLGRRIVGVRVPAAVVVAGLAALRLARRARRPFTSGDASLDSPLALARGAVDFLARDNPYTSQRARALLGWTPLVRHVDGVPDAFAWLRSTSRTNSIGDPRHTTK